MEDRRKAASAKSKAAYDFFGKLGGPFFTSYGVDVVGADEMAQDGAASKRKSTASRSCRLIA